MKLIFCCIAIFLLFAPPSRADDIVAMAYRTRVATAIDKRLDDLTEKQLIRIKPQSHEAWIDQFYWLTLDSQNKLLLARMLVLHCNYQITIYNMQSGHTLVTYTPSQDMNFAPKPETNPPPPPLIPRAAPWLR